MVLLALYDDGKTVVMLLELIGVFLHLCDGCFLNYCILGIFGDGIGGSFSLPLVLLEVVIFCISCIMTRSGNVTNLRESLLFKVLMRNLLRLS